MNRFQQGMLLGLILSVLTALALVLTFDEERRHQLSHLLKQLRPFASEAGVKAQKISSDVPEQVQEFTV
jgi:hypothetical protein